MNQGGSPLKTCPILSKEPRPALGKAKEMAGKITDDPKLEAEGKAEKIAGKVQEKVGQVKKILGK